MYTIWPLFGVILHTEARFDLSQSLAPTDYLECPPKCVCSKWSCIEDLDFSSIESDIKKHRLTAEEQDEKFRCWKNCCKKQGVQVSTCDRNVCQKCCHDECIDIKNMIRMRRKFASNDCNTCLQQHCAYQEEYISVFTTRSCRGLFNKYSTSFNESITFQVEAERDLKIFLYDEPLSLLRTQLRRRRDASTQTSDEDELEPEFERLLREQYESNGGDLDDLDILDDLSESDDLEDEFFEDEEYQKIQNMNDMTDEYNIYARIRREFDEQKEFILRKKQQERAENKRLAKIERVEARVLKLKQKSQKLMYGEIKADPTHADNQIDDLHNKLGRPLPSKSNRQLYNDKGLNVENDEAEEVEEFEENIDEDEERRNRQESIYEYEEEGEEPLSREEIKNQKILQRKQARKEWKEDKKRLDILSDKFRRLEAALSNPEISQKAKENSEKTFANEANSVFGIELDDVDESPADIMLNAVLGMYGWGDKQTKKTPDLTMIQSNLEDAYRQELKKNSKADKADWQRARIGHGIAEQDVAEFRVKAAHTASKNPSFARSISTLNSFLGAFQDQEESSRLEEGFTDEESGLHQSMLKGGWIQIGLGSSNNTACDLKSCQSSSYKRCIGVLRKRFESILSSNSPQEVTVTVTGQATERILTVDITDKLTKNKLRIFEVVIDDPTIAALKNMAVCTTKGSRGKLSFCCGNEAPEDNYAYFTDFRRMVDCQFSCLSSNCRKECMPETSCDQCLEQNCGKYTSSNNL